MERGHGFVVPGVEIIDDRLSQLVFGVEPGQEAGQGADLLEIADGIEAGVRAQDPLHPGIDVPQGAQMELLDPAALPVHDRALVEEGGLEAPGRGGIDRHSFQKGRRRQGRIGLAVFLGVQGLQPVIGETAAVAVENLVPVPEAFDQGAPVTDFDAGGPAQTRHIGGEGRRILDGQGPIGAERGADAEAEGGIGRHRGMEFQGVGGIVRGAEDFDPHPP